ncbi:MAG: ribbon-helix-helix protein, CopG family [Gemmatimonadetes bacterium]|nr:ribbon-helix-helix protein, CopG family [Gemmatimonadota bacterium]
MDDQLTLRIPRDLARALSRQARERAVPKSQVVREALAGYLGLSEAAAPAASVWERVRHLVGSVQLDAARIEADELSRRIRAHNWRE